jgi:hypothetical protein
VVFLVGLPMCDDVRSPCNNTMMGAPALPASRQQTLGSQTLMVWYFILATDTFEILVRNWNHLRGSAVEGGKSRPSFGDRIRLSKTGRGVRCGQNCQPDLVLVLSGHYAHCTLLTSLLDNWRRDEKSKGSDNNHS